MYETTYHRAASVDDAVAKLGNAQDGKFLAGGQTLLPTMKQRLAAPSDLIDIKNIDALKGIKANADAVTIGAAMTHAEVAASSDVKAVVPALAELANHIGDPAVRHMGTIGGSLANNDPAADYPAAVLGLNGIVNTNKRSIPADQYFSGLFETVLDEDEMIVSVSFSKPDRANYKKFPNPASRYAMAGVMVAKFADGSVRVAVTGAGSDGVFRHSEMEAQLAANWSPSALDGVATDPGMMLSDLHGSSEYRANLVGVMAKRAVADA